MHVLSGGQHEGDPEHAGDYISRLAWEPFGILPKELGFPPEIPT